MILFPIMVNIIVFDIIFLDVKDALANAIIYFLMLNYILFFNKEKIIEAFQSLTKTHSNKSAEKSNQLVRIGLMFLMILVIFGIDQFFVNLIRSNS